MIIFGIFSVVFGSGNSLEVLICSLAQREYDFGGKLAGSAPMELSTMRHFAVSVGQDRANVTCKTQQEWPGMCLRGDEIVPKSTSRESVPGNP